MRSNSGPRRDNFNIHILPNARGKLFYLFNCLLIYNHSFILANMEILQQNTYHNRSYILNSKNNELNDKNDDCVKLISNIINFIANRIRTIWG